MSFAVATFNLENLGRRGPAQPSLAARAAALRPVLERLAADVLCLQEVDAPRQGARGARGFRPLELLLQGTRYETYERVASARADGQAPADVHNLIILSRFPVESFGQVRHDFVPEWAWTPPGETTAAAAAFDRPILHALIRTPSGPLHVMNLHLRAPRAAHLPQDKAQGRWTSSAGWAKGFFLAAQMRQAQALEARLFAETLFDADPQARILVCGDFNADSFETPTRILCGAPEDASEGPFAERRLERLELRVEAERRHSVIHDGRRILLDHMLASPALAKACAQVDILNDGLRDEALADSSVAGSLHAPILARFD
ncbi:MAG: endonuclease/exonuclease/phosphatase family protein [Beijerinckiaceae bacterium]